MSYSLEEIGEIRTRINELRDEIRRATEPWMIRPKSKTLDKLHAIDMQLHKTDLYLENCIGRIQKDMQALALAAETMNELCHLPYLRTALRYPRQVEDPTLTPAHAKAKNKEWVNKFICLTKRVALLGLKVCNLVTDEMKATEAK